MAIPSPSKTSYGVLRDKLLRPALTSHYQCWFNPPNGVRNFSRANTYYDAERISILCSEASLPGSSIMTNEINDDYTGITERLGYRRQYDDRIDFTFYVDYGRQNETNNYSVILFFEEWMRYAMGETNEVSNGKQYFYRVNFPDDTERGYRTEIFISKFERDFLGQSMTYTLIGAYPISIASMPVSYESSQLLKCSVSFTFNRYVINRDNIPISNPEPTPATAPGVPTRQNSIDGQVGDFFTGGFGPGVA